MSFAILLAVVASGPSVLFVGNSYTAANGGLSGMVEQIYESVEPDTLTVEQLTTGGACFEDHWNNQSVREEILTGQWDTVIFQEQSCMPVIAPARTYTFGDSLAWLTEAAGCNPVFLMTWARKNDPLMLEGLRAGYSRMGAVHGSPVAPCGIAFELVRTGHPEINPYSTDGAHPSLQGSYLAACVIAATVYGIDLTAAWVWQPAEVSIEDGEILRLVADLACSSYLQPGGGVSQ
ncbi:MAG: hypothetical protein B1H09_04775 [Gemmatimonadaceae bacterium 4484_173]|nr:MAG: hypothetical protein B1H09_04775 [Gemmatimonadaceae bacterium 4484_173]